MNSPGKPNQMVSTLIRNISDAITIYSREDANAFNSYYLQAVTSHITLRDVEQGFTLNTQLNSLMSSMQAVSDSTTSDTLREMLWNPITAAMITAIRSMLSIDDVKQRVERKEATANLKPAKTGKITKPGTDKTRSNANQAPMPVSIETPAILDLNCPKDVENIVRHTIESQTERTFKNVRHVKCTKIGCKFCLTFAKALPLTKCSEIRCHRVNALCHPSGWYVHALPVVWHRILKEHDLGKEFTPSLVRPDDLAQVINHAPPSVPEPTPGPSFSSNSVKRARTMSLDDDSSRHSLASIMDHAASWAQECDDLEDDVVRVNLDNTPK